MINNQLTNRHSAAAALTGIALSVKADLKKARNISFKIQKLDFLNYLALL